MTEQEIDVIDREWRERIPSIRPYLSPNFPVIICLCGSTRFMETFEETNKRLTGEGKIVLGQPVTGAIDVIVSQFRRFDVHKVGSVQERPAPVEDYKQRCVIRHTFLFISEFKASRTRRTPPNNTDAR